MTKVQLVREGFRLGKTRKEIIAFVLEQFPDANVDGVGSLIGTVKRTLLNKGIIVKYGEVNTVPEPTGLKVPKVAVPVEAEVATEVAPAEAEVATEEAVTEEGDDLFS